MATPYNPTQQPYQPPIQAAYPPPVAYGYPPPQDQSASSAPYPSPTVQGYPPQGYPPQTHDIPPPYRPTLEQGPPPAYVYKPVQPAYGYQPQLANTTIVVAACTTGCAADDSDHHSHVSSRGEPLWNSHMRSRVLPLHAIHVWSVSYFYPRSHPVHHRPK